jgi:hypothetical protein
VIPLLPPEVLTDREKLVLCVADVPVPVIVIGYVPAWVVDAVLRVSVDEPPDVTEVGLKEADTPAGRPDAESATVCAEPEVTVVETVVVVDCPAVTVPAVGLSEMEKSFVLVPVTIECEMSQRFVSLDQVDCMAKVPVPITTLADAPWPELSQAHSSPFSCPP